VKGILLARYKTEGGDKKKNRGVGGKAILKKNLFLEKIVNRWAGKGGETLRQMELEMQRDGDEDV